MKHKTKVEKPTKLAPAEDIQITLSATDKARVMKAIKGLQNSNLPPSASVCKNIAVSLFNNNWI